MKINTLRIGVNNLNKFNRSKKVYNLNCSIEFKKKLPRKIKAAKKKTMIVMKLFFNDLWEGNGLLIPSTA